MAIRKIDYDRGVMIQKDPITGISVYMYLDTPGVYLSAHGTPVADSLAKAAGFDVEAHGKQRLMNERLAEAQAAIRREFEQREMAVLVVAERSGFEVRDIGLGRFQVFDPDGELLTKDPLSQELAMAVFDQLVPQEVPAPPEPEGRKAKGK